jgi:L-histidine N-alpha-methyltransferase
MAGMMSGATLDVYLTDADADTALRADARAGLTSTPKVLPPKWFYDAVGSELFERITELPEYYPFQAEREILRARAGEVASASGAECLVELGSGSSEKTRLLLDALTAGGTLSHYLPLDVSEAALREALAPLASEYPGLSVQGIVGDFTAHLAWIPAYGKRLLAFLGGTIGNLVPVERARFLGSVRRALNPGEQLLLGAGLAIDPEVMVPAYDDSKGITAEFNRNVLRVLNRELGADFEVESFSHVAVWNADQEWIEMRLRAERAMTVHVVELELEVSFAPGEEMRTETSAKFRPERLRDELDVAGFELAEWWTDSAERFALALATAR